MRAAGRGSVTPSVHGTLALLEAFVAPATAPARGSLARTMDLLRRAAAPFDRASYVPGHITASALVLSSNRQLVLLVYHRRLAQWLQPGGHVEPEDPSVLEAARREVFEETGIALDASADALVAVDIHEIPAARGEPAHLHHDLMFAFDVAGEPEPDGAESARWWRIEDLPAGRGDPALRRGLARALGTDRTVAR